VPVAVQAKLAAAVTLALAACVVAWVVVAVRWWERKPILAYQRRRPVPWQAIDLAAIIVVYLAMQAGVVWLAERHLGREAMRAPAMYVVDGPKSEQVNEHVVRQLILQGDAWVFALCVLSAAVAAPLAEEFFFRVLLQGWLEALQNRWRRQMPTVRRWIPLGVGPILITSLVFARMHFRVAGPPINAQYFLFLVTGNALASLAAVVFAVVLLRWRTGARAADFGWTPGKTQGDLGIGLAAFAAVVPPVYLLQYGMQKLLPQCVAPDPIPLFFLAIALGVIYFRTHRLLPLVVLHAALNAATLALTR
jgi:membrane protease YdiL (CAAX protease family)